MQAEPVSHPGAGDASLHAAHAAAVHEPATHDLAHATRTSAAMMDDAVLLSPQTLPATPTPPLLPSLPLKTTRLGSCEGRGERRLPDAALRSRLRHAYRDVRISGGASTG